MKIRPLHDRVIVKRLEEERKTGWRHRHPGHRHREADAGRR
jgi:co-chaperonin GroES (HSP10)